MRLRNRVLKRTKSNRGLVAMELGALKRFKKQSLIAIHLILALYILVLIFSKFTTLQDWLVCLGIYLLFLLFTLIIFWLRGNGTIDSNARFSSHMEI